MKRTDSEKLLDCISMLDRVIKKSKYTKKNSVKDCIVQYDVDGESIGRFTTIAEASKITNVGNKLISKCLNGYQKTAGGYKWIYDFDQEKELS